MIPMFETLNLVHLIVSALVDKVNHKAIKELQVIYSVNGLWEVTEEAKKIVRMRTCWYMKSIRNKLLS